MERAIHWAMPLSALQKGRATRLYNHSAERVENGWGLSPPSTASPSVADSVGLLATASESVRRKLRVQAAVVGKKLHMDCDPSPWGRATERLVGFWGGRIEFSNMPFILCFGWLRG